MQIKYDPNFVITAEIARCLMRIEEIKERVAHLPLTPTVLASLRETAYLYSTHYSTMIEGNALTQAQVEEVLKHEGHFPGRERDEGEVKGYYAALTHVEQLVAEKVPFTEKTIQTLHALVMAKGRTKVTPTPYRDGQNVIRDAKTGHIVYMPPEAKDVSGLMKGLVKYFVEGMVVSFENVLRRMDEAGAQGFSDKGELLRKLDPRQRRVLKLFQEYEVITAKQICKLFGFRPRTGAQLCHNWVQAGFLEIADPSNKGRTYALSQTFCSLKA